MKIVLLRVGIDKGCGGCLGPVFKNGDFEFIPIPTDNYYKRLNCPTYADIKGINTGKRLSNFVPHLHDYAVHDDPNFKTFTYGDPTQPKASLRKLKKGDILIFYAGLTPWDFKGEDALYLIGYFIVDDAFRVGDKNLNWVKSKHKDNWHVKFCKLTKNDNLVIVKGGNGSRLFKNAILLSEKKLCDGNGKKYYRAMDCISSRMQNIFGDFYGKISLERSPPRWVRPEFVTRAYNFIISIK